MEDLARCPGIGERKVHDPLSIVRKLNNRGLRITVKPQVKRLYDTFHEPFKRATSSYPSVVEPTIPEAPVQKDVSSKEPVEEDEDFVEDSRKRKKKEPEKTVKTALSAVFARYSDKLSKKKEKQKEKDATAESDAEIHQD